MKGKRKKKAATRLARSEITGDVKPSYIGERGKKTGLMLLYLPIPSAFLFFVSKKIFIPIKLFLLFFIFCNLRTVKIGASRYKI